MQPLGDVLQNSCSKPLLKKQLNHTYEKLHCGIFYNKSRTTVMGSWGTGGPRVPWVPGLGPTFLPCLRKPCQKMAKSFNIQDCIHQLNHTSCLKLHNQQLITLWHDFCSIDKKWTLHISFNWDSIQWALYYFCLLLFLFLYLTSFKINIIQYKSLVRSW